MAESTCDPDLLPTPALLWLRPVRCPNIQLRFGGMEGQGRDGRDRGGGLEGRSLMTLLLHTAETLAYCWNPCVVMKPLRTAETLAGNSSSCCAMIMVT